MNWGMSRAGLPGASPAIWTYYETDCSDKLQETDQRNQWVLIIYYLYIRYWFINIELIDQSRASKFYKDMDTPASDTDNLLSFG